MSVDHVHPFSLAIFPLLSGLGVSHAGEDREIQTPDWWLQDMGQEILSWGVPIGPVILAFGAHLRRRWVTSRIKQVLL